MAAHRASVSIRRRWRYHQVKAWRLRSSIHMASTWYSMATGNYVRCWLWQNTREYPLASEACTGATSCSMDQSERLNGLTSSPNQVLVLRCTDRIEIRSVFKQDTSQETTTAVYVCTFNSRMQAMRSGCQRTRSTESAEYERAPDPLITQS